MPVHVGEAVAVELLDQRLVVDVSGENDAVICQLPESSMEWAVVIRAAGDDELPRGSRREKPLNDQIGVVLGDKAARNEIVVVRLNAELSDDQRIHRRLDV